MSTHNIGLYEDLTKNIFQLSSNTLLETLMTGFFCDNIISHVNLLIHVVNYKKRSKKKKKKKTLFINITVGQIIDFVVEFDFTKSWY